MNNDIPDPRKTQDPRSDPLTPSERAFAEHMRNSEAVYFHKDGVVRLLAILDRLAAENAGLLRELNTWVETQRNWGTPPQQSYAAAPAPDAPDTATAPEHCGHCGSVIVTSDVNPGGQVCETCGYTTRVVAPATPPAPEADTVVLASGDLMQVAATVTYDAPEAAKTAKLTGPQHRALTLLLKNNSLDVGGRSHPFSVHPKTAQWLLEKGYAAHYQGRAYMIAITPAGYMALVADHDAAKAGAR